MAAVAFSPDGKLVLTGSHDGTARLWRTDTGAPVGVVTDRDIALRAVAAGKDTAQCKASDYMTSPVRSVPMDTSLADVCAAMESAQVRRMPVVDGDGRLCGVVAQADIALAGNSQHTAEVVREVSKPC